MMRECFWHRHSCDSFSMNSFRDCWKFIVEIMSYKLRQLSHITNNINGMYKLQICFIMSSYSFSFSFSFWFNFVPFISESGHKQTLSTLKIMIGCIHCTYQLPTCLLSKKCVHTLLYIQWSSGIHQLFHVKTMAAWHSFNSKTHFFEWNWQNGFEFFELRLIKMNYLLE